MGQTKETFEKWSSKKKPDSGAPPKESEESRRLPPLRGSSRRAQMDSMDRRTGKGMKYTPCNSPGVPHLSVGIERGPLASPIAGKENDISEISGGVRSVQGKVGGVTNNDDDRGSTEFSKRDGKRRVGVSGDSHSERDKRDQRGKSTLPTEPANEGPRNQEKVRKTRVREVMDTSSRMRRRKSLSASSEGEEGERQDRSIVMSRREEGNHRSSSADEEYERPSQRRESLRSECKGPSIRHHKETNKRGERENKRQRYNSDSSRSDNGRTRRSSERMEEVERRSSSRDDESGDHNGESGGSPQPLVGTDLSEGSGQFCRRRRPRSADGYNSSASELRSENDNLAITEVKSETALRKQRRDKQKLRERQVRSREKQGQKAYYLHVNHNGKPYGDGLPAWKSDLNKLARNLDPSVMDVREQPPTEMATLRRRLRQNFDYSQAVDPIYIRQLVGRAITQWRNILWKKIDAGQDRPKGFDSDIWKRLERTRACPSHNEKSERMRHANSCRITLGRTGPRGEEGVRELLRLERGVSPDYDEVFTEMQRDKGYGGRAAQKEVSKKTKQKIAGQSDAIEVRGSVPEVGEGKLGKNVCPSTSRVQNNEGAPLRNDYIGGLLSQIAELQAAVAIASKGGSASGEGVSVNNFEKDNVESAGTGRLILEPHQEDHVGTKVRIGDVRGKM